MKKTLLLIAMVLWTDPAWAAPLTLPAGAVQIGARSDSPVRYALPIAAYDGTKVPTQVVTGMLDQRAFRIEGTANTLALQQPLAEQLAAQGYTEVFTCQTTACGGFDFRFAVDVLPEPQMHIDLGDFSYLAAINGAGEAVSLLVSRTADQGFVQITAISPATKPMIEVAAPPPDPAQSVVALEPEPSPTEAVQAETAPPPDVQSPPPGDLAASLMTTGSVALDDLIFASGKATLQDQEYASLQALADWLKAHPDMKVTLVGHTDASGSLVANTALSKQRAAAVRAWLVQHYGASAAQIDAQGAGYLSPRATNQTAEGRTKNRRVEVMITSTPVK